MLSNNNTSVPVGSFFTSSTNHNDIPPFSDVSIGSVYSDPDESFESLIPNSPRLDDFTILKLLGVGGHSKVFLIQEKLTSRLQALKVISKGGHQGQFDSILSEQRIQAKLSVEDHDCFLPLISSWHDGNNFYLISEYLGGGDMAFEMIRSRTFDEDRARFYVAELVIALEVLHSHKIIHRDVKPANIMFRADGHIVLGDFGYAKLFDAPTGRSNSPFDAENPPEYVSFDVTADSDSGSFLTEESYTASEFCGTSYYMAPEQHLGGRYSFEIDYWSVGVILYRMLTGRMPFGEDVQNRSEIGSCVVNDELRFLESDNASPAARDLLNGLLAKSPADRLSLHNIKKHPFFKGFSWEKAVLRELKAPWIPYISPAPKQCSTTLVITQGIPYDIVTDPFPQFRFTCSKIYQRRPQPVKKVKGSRQTFKKASSFLESLFKKSPSSRVAPTPKILRPPLRPLILPGMVKERSGSGSPVSIVKEKPFLESGLLSESSYSAYSKHIKSPILTVAPPSRVVVISPSTLGHGNPGTVDIVYPDTTACSTDSVNPLACYSPTISHSHAVCHPPAGSLSTTVLDVHSGSVVPIPTGSSRSRSGSCVVPGSCAPSSASSAFLSVSCPPIPNSRHPAAGSAPPKNINGRKKHQGGPPGLAIRPKTPVEAPTSTKHTGRPHPRNNSKGGPWTAPNNSPRHRPGREVHPNVLLNAAKQPTNPRTPGRQSRPQGQQGNLSNAGKARSASPSVSNEKTWQRPTLSPSVTSAPGYLPAQPFIVKFNLIPDDMRIGRRHPAFLPSVPDIPELPNPHDPQPIVQADSIAQPQLYNGARGGRGRPSASPSTTLAPLPSGPTPSRPHSVKPAMISDKTRADNRRNFSAPVPRVPGRPRDTQNVPHTRSHSNTHAPPVSSTLKHGVSRPSTFIPPPVPAIPERFLGACDPRDGVRSAPISPQSIYKDQPEPVPNSSVSAPEGVPTTLVARFKSWIRRLFGRGHSDLTIRKGLETSN